jgi:hypothetical protein
MAIEYPDNYALGQNKVKSFPKVQYDKIVEIIDTVNDLTDGSISTTDLTITDDLTVGDDATITGSVITNTIEERTAAAGVTIDSALIKDATIKLDDGAVDNLAVKLGADANNGIYGVSDTQMGFAVEGALKAGVDTNGVFTNNISEQTATVGVTIDGLTIKDSRLEYNATGFFGVTKSADTTLTIDETGFIFGNKATALTLTLPATVVGYSYFIVNIDGSAVINVDPAAADYIGGAGLTKVDNKDLIIPAVKGAYAQIIADGVNGWYIAQASGTLTKEA